MAHGLFLYEEKLPGLLFYAEKGPKKGRAMTHGSFLYVEEWPMGHLSGRVISLHYMYTITSFTALLLSRDFDSFTIAICLFTSI